MACRSRGSKQPFGSGLFSDPDQTFFLSLDTDPDCPKIRILSGKSESVKKNLQKTEVQVAFFFSSYIFSTLNTVIFGQAPL